MHSGTSQTLIPKNWKDKNILRQISLGNALRNCVYKEHCTKKDSCCKDKRCFWVILSCFSTTGTSDNCIKPINLSIYQLIYPSIHHISTAGYNRKVQCTVLATSAKYHMPHNHIYCLPAHIVIHTWKSFLNENNSLSLSLPSPYHILTSSSSWNIISHVHTAVSLKINWACDRTWHKRHPGACCDESGSVNSHMDLSSDNRWKSAS